MSDLDDEYDGNDRERLADWLDAKYSRHGELEDKEAAEMLRQDEADLRHARLPEGWAVEKENGQYRVSQMRGDEWVRATWVDSPVLTMFFDALMTPNAGCTSK